MGIDGERLKKLRLSRGLSPGQIADKLGISRQGYNQYEDGTTRNPRKLEALASFFNVTTDFLLGKGSHPVADPKGYYNDPDVADRVEAIQENPKLRLLMDASKDLSNEDIDYVVKLVQTLRKAHGIDCLFWDNVRRYEWWIARQTKR